MRGFWSATLTGLALILFMGTGVLAAPSQIELSGVNRDSTETAFPGGFELVSQVSILVPSGLVLSNAGFEMAYDDASAGVPAFLLGVAIPLLSWNRLLVYGQLQAGYSFKQGLYSIRARDGSSTEPRQEVLKLHRVPLISSIKMMYALKGLSFVKPTLTLGAGAQWLHHSGESGGLDGAYWVPYFFVAPALTFFERSAGQDWFAGFTFGVSYQNSLSLTKKFTGWSFDLSANLIL